VRRFLVVNAFELLWSCLLPIFILGLLFCIFASVLFAISAYNNGIIQRELQLCNKYNAVGYDAYEMCRKYGAIINNAHEHSYARTHTMTDLSGAGNLSILDNSNNVTLDKGQVFIAAADALSFITAFCSCC
jgi:hypothetical protein